MIILNVLPTIFKKVKRRKCCIVTQKSDFNAVKTALSNRASASTTTDYLFNFPKTAPKNRAFPRVAEALALRRRQAYGDRWEVLRTRHQRDLRLTFFFLFILIQIFEEI